MKHVSLPFFHQLLARGQRYQRTRQSHRARALYGRLLAFPDLPSTLAGTIHSRLGTLALRERRFRLARRHLRQALRHRQNDPAILFRLGLALARDPSAPPEHALVYFRRSLTQAPDHPLRQAETGLLLIRLGRSDEGLACLRQAVATAPADAGVVGRLARGLCQSGRPDEALREVRHALFLAPRCGRLRKLNHELQLAALHRRQELARARQEEPEPVLLPFLRPVSSESGFRHDAPATLPGPHLVRLRVRADRRAT